MDWFSQERSFNDNYITPWKSPYVHSAFENFAKLPTLPTHSSNPDVSDNLISTLQKLSNLLKNQADTFLDGMSVQEASRQLFKSQDLASIAIEASRSSDFRTWMSGTKSQGNEAKSQMFDKASEIFGQEMVEMAMKEFPEYANEKTYRLDKALFNYVQKQFQEQSNSGNYTAEYNMILNNINSKCKDLLETQATKIATNRKTKMWKAIKQYIGETSLNWDRIWNSNEDGAFISRCMAVWGKYFHDSSIESQQAALNTFKEMGTEIAKQFGAITGTNEASLTGYLSEELKTAVWKVNKGNALEWDITPIGDISDQEVMETINPTLVNKLKEITYKNVGKQSPSDWLFTNKNNMTVRVQDKSSKNLIDDADELVNSKLDMKLQDSIQYYTFIESIQAYNNNLLSDEEIGILSYLLANQIWFKGLLGTPVPIANPPIQQLLSHTIPYLLGIGTADDPAFNTVDIKDLIATYGNRQDNNVFYLFGNRTLIPTYMILDEFIKIVEKYNTTNAGILLDYTSSFTPSANYAQFIREEKQKAENETKLLEVGKSVGAEITSSIKINAIKAQYRVKGAFERLQTAGQAFLK